MKYSLILLGLLIVLVQCKRDKTDETESVEEQTTVSEAAGGTAVAFTPPALSDINFDEIVTLQAAIMQHPVDKNARQDFLGKAYYPSKAALVTVGIGRLRHPETGQPLSRPMVKRAAQMDANRWAAYGRSWLKNDLNPDFGALDTTFQGLQTVLMSFEKGDSLYLAVANEVH